ncbi:MAG: DNA gyrase inhibitor YacG [Gemmataceae bacterium]|nr:DNA gyrase inhibitor YacG [Gemmataceae bacterium]MCS7270992.1 DNA gyrase inhibitor YacG [Gemmataceae bacterium]
MSKQEEGGKTENSRSRDWSGPMKPMRCPICDAAMPGNWQDYPDYPFCSKRCRIIDLGRWLNEEYRIVDAASDEDRSSTPPAASEE